MIDPSARTDKAIEADLLWGVYGTPRHLLALSIHAALAGALGGATGMGCELARVSGGNSPLLTLT